MASMRAGSSREKPSNNRHDPPPAGARKSWRSPLEERLTRADLSSRRARLLRTILNHAEDTYFLTSRKLAERYEVDVATIVRTIQALGYEKYEDFVSDLRAHFVLNITPYTVMKAATREHRSIANHVQHSLEMDTQNLAALRASLDVERVVQLAREVGRSRHIVVVGLDLAATLSYMLAYTLTTLGFHAESPIGATGTVQQRINLLGPKDLVIAISFGRCLRETVNAARRAHALGVPTFGITDTDRSPIARYCDSFWTAPVGNPAFNGSYVAPMAALNALLVACAHIRPQRTLALLKQKQEELLSGTRWFPLEEQETGTELLEDGNGNRTQHTI
jgi:DNA-binding MurR/RpiR family transcriptional regulator